MEKDMNDEELQMPDNEIKPPRERITNCLSKTVNELPEYIEQPLPEISCLNCPLARWYATNSTLNCYCKMMYTITWNTKSKGDIVACDGIYEKVEE
jgi:hypothetical protein